MDGLDRSYLLEQARRVRGLTQAQLAKLAGTSQATLSAYERGAKSPSLKVAQRIIAATGHDLNLRVHIDWVEHKAPSIERFWVPNILWGVETPICFATLEYPDWIGGTGMRDWDLRDREERKGLYEQLIRRGQPDEMIRWMDGALLVDIWRELELPDPVREAWKWAIVIARNPGRFSPYDYTDTTSTAWVRSAKPVLPPPPPAPRPPRRTRFDHHPLPPSRMKGSEE